jgi:hypothetical protein
VEALEDRRLLAIGDLLQTLPDPNTAQADSFFGYDVAADGALCVVGEMNADVEGVDHAGQAHLFDATTGNLLRTLSSPDPGADDGFGQGVAVSGSIVVVGAYRDDTGATNAGSAYVFDAATGELKCTLNNPTPAEGDQFGLHVAVSGSIVVVGAYLDDTGATDAGSAHVFDATTGELKYTLSNPAPAEGDLFGYDVGVSGTTVVVSAKCDDTGATDAGSAYVFDAATGELQWTLNNPTPQSQDEFGLGVAVSGSTVVVGAWEDNTDAEFAGSAYLFDATTGSLLHTLNNPTPEYHDYFGCSVAVSGSTVVIGANYDNTGATDAGSAYVFDAATGNLLCTLNNPTPEASDFFANGVAVSGGRVLVGAPYADTTELNVGVAYVFDANRAPSDVSLSTSNVPENSVSDTVVGSLSTTDVDAGDTFAYTLVDSAGGRFKIVGAQVQVDNGALLDFETTTSHTIRVRTTDQGGTGLSYEQDLTITVTNVNESPTNIGISGGTVAENSTAGTVAGTLSTSDPDAGDTFTYALLDSAGGRFKVVGAQVQVDNGALLDFEMAIGHTIRVQTTDQGGSGLSCEQDLVITLTSVNETPTAIALLGTSVTENTATGTLVGSLSTTDVDAGDTFAYTLVDSASGRFKIVGDQVQVADGTLLDFETTTSHTIRVRTTDQGGSGLSYEKNFTITLTNVNEAPTALALAGTSVAENSATGTVIGTLTTADPDAGDTFTYTLVASAGGRFKLEGDQVLVADGTLLDYETATSYIISLQSTDAGGLSVAQDLTISLTDVNEAPTDITLSVTALAENRPLGAVVGELGSVDPDIVLIVGVSLYTYELVPGSGDEDNGSFSIQVTNFYGLKTYKLVSNAVFDFETENSYSVRIRTTDRGGLSYEKAFTITVTDAHDFDSAAVFDPVTSTFYLRGDNISGAADYSFAYGVPDSPWKTLVGDWNGDGSSGVGLFAPATSTFYLTDAYATGTAQYTFGYGVPNGGWIPLVGDWNGDGAAGVGLYDPATSTFYLTDMLATGVAEYTFGYGVPDGGWTAIVGDWDGSGNSGVGLYDPHDSTFYLTNTLQTGVAEYTFGYGVPNGGWTPLVGDWNGNGSTGVGLYDPAGSTFYLTDTLATGCAEYTFAYGVPGGGWTPLVGDWNGDRAAGVGLYDAAGTTFYLSSALQTGVAEHTVQIAEASSGCVPLVGCWTENPVSISVAAVDQVHLASVTDAELESLSASSLDNAAAIDQVLAEL